MGRKLSLLRRLHDGNRRRLASAASRFRNFCGLRPHGQHAMRQVDAKRWSLSLGCYLQNDPPTSPLLLTLGFRLHLVTAAHQRQDAAARAPFRSPTPDRPGTAYGSHITLFAQDPPRECAISILYGELHRSCGPAFIEELDSSDGEVNLPQARLFGSTIRIIATFRCCTGPADVWS